MTKTIIIALLFVSLYSCDDTSNNDNKKSLGDSVIIIDSSENKHEDTLADNQPGKDTVREKTDSTESDTALLKMNSIKGWSIDDFIIKCSENHIEELRMDIEYEIKQWKDVKNPIIAKYKGIWLGDYFHFDFVDEQGREYDFGFGNNNLGKYILYDVNDELGWFHNKRYLNKSFKIWWDWRVSSYPCCSGDYELVETYHPSIIKIELTD